MMKPKEIQELLDFIANSGLAEVNIETEQFKINVKRNATAASYVQGALPQVIHSTPLPVQQVANNTPAATGSEKNTENNSTANSKQITIKSPMIGTFYRSSSPETPSFVNVGDEIAVGKTLCIIEAMKLFNEIESELEGKIVKILVENATPVEFDQPLFIIEQK
ncbi:MAG TPA: acetyl-CoA carboxylase biotin carboxyl carrier protein [Cytophagaceae bacterium]|jgi:acetyl-CoA carboxylase biotin carboxyl carrier protein|nr:acetyl-CoA carboxylase biotin carboxyl carrier protein [Cytophagaceae bacterium]